ncbi:MAG: hypothetical protein AVDCRST_MAG77-5258 [uncultured Chloroflexi bacterium]|uniref:DUF4129 domain-containing protein n=1 Tax=uncultured Chloroflexota bacterium TaxID=166587 RepID=A0A6J4K675_9CHLR|nr:MAG: hypothetical protein AVDCRST_MAG77-5258 [uncultured Chloroflexota bacterium]
MGLTTTRLARLERQLGAARDDGKVSVAFVRRLVYGQPLAPPTRSEARFLASLLAARPTAGDGDDDD